MSLPSVSRTDGWVERRHARFRVLLRATMRCGGDFAEVCIRDISTNGMLAQAFSPPPRGTFVEFVGLAVPIVGQVVWRHGRRFGVEVQGKLNVSLILNVRPPEQSSAVTEAPTKTARARGPKREARSIGLALQFAALAVAATIGTIWLSMNVYRVLTRASDAITLAIPGPS